MNTRDYLTKSAYLFPDNIVLVHKETRLTTKMLVDRIYKVSNALLRLGLQKGDRVAVLLHNCHQCVECFLGIQCAGLVLVPLNARNSPLEHHYILENSEAKAILVGQEFIKDLEGITQGLQKLDTVIAVAGEVGPNAHDYEAILAQASADEPSVELDLKDMNSLRYTSGTTGRPKGVIHDHLSTNTAVYNILTSGGFSIEEGDTIALSGPVTHASGSMIFPHIICGGRIIVLSHFDAGEILELIQKERVKTIYMVPTMIVMLMNHPGVKNYDLSSLKTIRYGASPIAPEVLKKAIDIFGNVFIQGYGLTEATMPITILSKKDHILDGSEKKMRRLASIGRDTMAARVAIMDDDGNILPPDTIGEIVIKSRQNMTGYWKNPEATEKALRYGWLHTRDMGYRDEDGYIFLVDRKEDMIISGGFNIYPKEVEDVIYEHPAVLEAVVFGIPDEKWGESVKAVISLAQGEQTSASEIIEFCKKRMASYKKPKTVEFVSDIPKSAVGKISRKVLRDPYWKKKARNIN